jgi:predicted ATPase/class 3 adenylate cyclase
MAKRELPTGTVTFLFSDIEGSTQLVRELGSEAFTDALEQHHRAIRGAIAANGGIELGTEGDSFFVVFREPRSAVDAAVQAQITLAAATLPNDTKIRVRMGLHTGIGVLGGDEYVGLDVNRAARIAAAGHGGQVLISDATRSLVAGALPEGVRLQPLGSYRLKDLPEPEALWQVEIRGLPAAFPPLRALDVRRAHLPPDATTFVGRSVELDGLGRLLANRRLITLTGPGGAGKTRLALRAASRLAERFPDGAFFVPLATIRRGGELPSAVASTLAVPEEAGRSVGTVLADWMRDRDLLLVLDNLEQIADCAAAVDALLSSASDLRVLATSRSPIRIAGEQEFPVRPFPAVDPAASTDVLEASDAVRLFIDRARLVRPDLSPDDEELALIAEIADGVDGLPLAIELAAARLRVLPLAAIRDRLHRRLDALVGGPSNAPQRQRTLRDTIAWSYELLDEPGRALFRRLGVFAGGWTLEAAEAIGAGRPVRDVEALLGTLVEQSLVQASPVAGEPRFTMLPTIAEYATEELELSDESREVADRHTRYIRGLAEGALEHADSANREAWFDRLDADLDNVRAAIERVARTDDPAPALAIAAALRPFWLQRNRGGEGLRLLCTLAEHPGASNGRDFAAATAAAAAIATWLGDYAIGRRMGGLSVTAYRRLGDRWGFAEAVGSYAFATIEIDPTAALALNGESLEAYRELGDVRGEGQALLGRATVRFALGELAETRESLERSIELLRQAGDHSFALFCGIFLGRIKLLMGDVEGGMGEYRSVLESSRDRDLRLGIALAFDYLAEVASHAGDTSRAVRLGATALRLKEELGGGVPPRMGGAPDPLEVGRDSLTPDEFERESAAGRDMDLDSAVAEALAIQPPSSLAFERVDAAVRGVRAGD